MCQHLKETSFLTTLVEFLGSTLGPNHEVVFYRLFPDNTGVTAQLEMVPFTSQREGSPMPQDIKLLLDEKRFDHTAYLTGLTSLDPAGHILNTGLLYLQDVPGIPRGVLAIYANSSLFLDLSNALIRMGNLNTKFAYPSPKPENLKNKKLIRIPAPPPLEETGEPEESLTPQDTAIARMEALIGEIMGEDMGNMDEYTQERRMRIVERLYRDGIFSIKGMIRQAAGRLYCSDATIYRYLSYLKS